MAYGDPVREDLNELTKRIATLRDDLNGMQEWMARMEGRIGKCRQELDDTKDAGKTLFRDVHSYEAETNRALRALDERIAKLEGSGEGGASDGED